MLLLLLLLLAVVVALDELLPFVAIFMLGACLGKTHEPHIVIRYKNGRAYFGASDLGSDLRRVLLA
jgi:hypothetical protein